MDMGILGADLSTSTHQFFPNTQLIPTLEPTSTSMAQVLPAGQSPCQHSPEEWEARKQEITRLYVDEKLPLQTVINTMKMRHGFSGTTKQYKDRIEKWGINVKNFKASEMKAAVRKRQQRRLVENKETRVRIRGREVEPEKIEKFMKRNGISESSNYWPTSPAASTPSVISCYTPSVGGPPTPGEAFGEATLAMESTTHWSNLSESLESCPHSNWLTSIDLTTVDELAEESFHSGEDAPNHGQPDQGDDQMEDYQIEDISNEDVIFREMLHGGIASYRSDPWRIEYEEEVSYWGEDLGLQDLDVDMNDDANAIAGAQHSFGSVHPIKFEADVKPKVMLFAAHDYYVQPVSIKIPRSLEPLLPSLLENPTNLLYFHHFMSHTSPLLVNHQCRFNPSQNILVKLAIQDECLMNLLLAYSASHRAQLLRHPEPTKRIALWLRDIFPGLKSKFSSSNALETNLAMALMLVSLGITSPKMLEDYSLRPYFLHHAFTIVKADRLHPIHYERSDVSHFLCTWLLYYDVLGCPLVGASDPLRSIRLANHLLTVDGAPRSCIECLYGFTGSYFRVLTLIAELVRQCDLDRIDNNGNIRPEWVPSLDTAASAGKFIIDFETSEFIPLLRPCTDTLSPHDRNYQSDIFERTKFEDAYRCAALVYLHRRVLGKSIQHRDVKIAVSGIIGALFAVRKGSNAEFHLLFPMFTAGYNTEDPLEKHFIMERMQGLEGLGMGQVKRARTLMQKVWDTGKPYETLVSGGYIMVILRLQPLEFIFQKLGRSCL